MAFANVPAICSIGTIGAVAFIAVGSLALLGATFVRCVKGEAGDGPAKSPINWTMPGYRADGRYEENEYDTERYRDPNDPHRVNVQDLVDQTRFQQIFGNVNLGMYIDDNPNDPAEKMCEILLMEES